MANNIFTTPIFENRFKRYSKKIPSLDEEILDLEETLINNPEHLSELIYLKSA